VERLARATKSSSRKNLNSHTIGKFNYARQFEYDQSIGAEIQGGPKLRPATNHATLLLILQGPARIPNTSAKIWSIQNLLGVGWQKKQWTFRTSAVS
jgi:hypothetical protein